MNLRSLHFRLTGWYAGWLAVVFIAFGMLSYIATKHYLETNLRDLLKLRANQVADVLRNLDGSNQSKSLKSEIEIRFAPEANNRFVRVTQLPNTVRYRSGPPADGSFDPNEFASSTVTNNRPIFDQVASADGDAVYIARSTVETASGTQIIEFGTSGRSIESALRGILVTFLVALPAMFLVAAAGGFALVRLALKPVDQIIQTAERISHSNLEARLPVPHSGDEIERLSNALNNMIQRLGHAFAANSRFMADSSHELRTPLTIMRAELESFLAVEGRDPASLRLAVALLEEIDRLTGIVGGLLEISRLDSGEDDSAAFHVDLASIVSAVAEQVEPLAHDKQLGIEMHTSGPVFVRANPAAIKQITVNLLDNAIKYTPPGGKIQISVGTRGQQAMLQVSDTGIGIPDAAIPQVFDRFFRVDKSRASDGGSGLGLSIVRSICTSLGGSVSVTSQLGKGSRFSVVLPQAQNR